MRLFTVSNIITLSNLLCGTLGIMAVLQQNNLKAAGLLLALALVLDFFDGFVARLLKESSELGKQLDSLADVVSFGVLPGLIMYTLIINTGFFPENTEYIGLIIPLFSALRLAKFNIDTRQAMGFIGLPTPANGLVIASFPYLLENNNWFSDYMSNSWFFVIYTAAFCYLLIAELPLPALKFKTFKWSDNKFTFSFLAISLLLVLVLQLTAVPIIIFGYILYAVIVQLKNKRLI